MIALKEESAIIRSFIFIKFETENWCYIYKLLSEILHKVDDIQQIAKLCKAWKVIKNEDIKLLT